MSDQVGGWIGPYEVLREIARGGQGAVLEARHGELGTRVALKLLLDDDPRQVARFQQEAKVMARLRHPNLPVVSDMGTTPRGASFFAMELIEGSDLRQRVRAGGLPDPEWIVGVLAPIARALDHCHEQGVIHRDLKPRNVLVEEASGRPLLADFGIVKRDRDQMALTQVDEAGRLSLTGEVTGTPAYMAPEQADPSFGPIAPPTDVYALGATLFFLLTGQAPLGGEATINLLVKLMREPPPDPQERRPDAPPGLSEVCRRCMRKDPAERYSSAAEVADALEAALAPARGRAVWAAGLVLLLGLGVGLGLWIAQGASGDPGLSASPSTPSAPVRIALRPNVPCRVSVFDAQGAVVPDAASGAPLREARLESISLRPGRYRLRATAAEHHPLERELLVTPGLAEQALPLAPELRWRHKSEAQLWRAQVVRDLDGDGAREVLVQTARPQRASALSGRDGHPLWHAEHSLWRNTAELEQPRHLLVIPRRVQRRDELAWVTPRTGEDQRDPWRPQGLPTSPVPLAGGAEGLICLLTLPTEPAGRALVFLGPEGRERARVSQVSLGHPLDGRGSSVPVVYDGDGDGRPDLAVWRVYRTYYVLGLDPPLEKVREFEPPRGESVPSYHLGRPMQGDAIPPVSPDGRGVLLSWVVRSGEQIFTRLQLIGRGGAKRWVRDLPDRYYWGSWLELAEGPVFAAGTTPGKFYKPARLTLLDGRSGEVLREHAVPDGLTGPPLLHRGRGGRRSILLGALDPTEARLLDPRSFSLLWRRDVRNDDVGPKVKHLYYEVQRRVADLDGDGADEVVVLKSWSREALCFDPVLPPE